MNTLRATGLGLAISLLMAGTGAQAQDVDLSVERNQISYSVGVNIGQNLAMQGLADQIDLDAFIAGLRDIVQGEPKMSEEQVMTALMSFQQQLIQQQQEAAESARSEGLDFLAQNARRSGVTTTASGLQYEVLESGAASGSSPSASDAVLAHYEGRLIDGEIFDSSIQRGEPVEFQLNQVIPGWTEGLQLMKPGDKWRLYIPYELAYGAAGSGPIPPFSVLVFDVELLEINP